MVYFFLGVLSVMLYVPLFGGPKHLMLKVRLGLGVNKKKCAAGRVFLCLASTIKVHSGLKSFEMVQFREVIMIANNATQSTQWILNLFRGVLSNWA